MRGPIVFAEHRFFGESLPKGNQSYKQTNLRYLTIEQSLEDFAQLIEYVRTQVYRPYRQESRERFFSGEKIDEEEKTRRERKKSSKEESEENENESQEEDEHESPVVVIGAGYGGMLAAWMRMKYPHVVIVALASSAPLVQTNTGDFARLVTQSFADSDPKCVDVIRRSWTDLRNDNGTLSAIKSLFGLCRSVNDTRVFKDWLRFVWNQLAVYNYPFATQIVKPLPAYSVNVI